MSGTAPSPERLRIVLRWRLAGEPAGVLEWTVAESNGSARLVGASGADELDTVRVSVLTSGPLLHIDAGDSLSATIRLDDRGATLLYARTSMLARLGVGAGRARVEGCEVVFDEPVPVVVRGRVSSS